MPTPGLLAYVILGLWVPVSIAAFFLMRPERAALFVVLGAVLFLPEVAFFKFPLLPPLHKDNIPYICVFLGLLLRSPSRIFKRPKERWFTFLIGVLMVGALATALTNDDSLQYGKYRITSLPGLNLKDGFYMAIDEALRVGLPFLLGASLFRTSKSLRDLLAGFAIAGLIYIPFALVETRLSPQFHNWIYGYHQHSFDQTLRWGGYRPMVFMAHGLTLARFFLVALVSTLLIREKRRTLLRIPTRWVAILLFVTIILCKSTGAILYALFAVPILALSGVRVRQTLAVCFAFVVMAYPVLRQADLFPVTDILEAAGEVAADREQSLLFRFQNEDVLLAKARQRIVFGWGQYGRNETYDVMGKPASVTDGQWIILVSILGVVGFVAEFAILLVPLFIARRRLRAIRDKDDALLVSGLSLLLGIVAIDLLPNALWSAYPYLLAGALTGATRAMAMAQKKATSEALVLRASLPDVAAF